MRRSVNNKKQKKRVRDGADDVAAAAVIQRVAAAAELMAVAQRRRLQAIECSVLAAFIVPCATRLLEGCATEVLALLQEDAARAQPLLDLHHQLHVRPAQPQTHKCLSRNMSHSACHVCVRVFSML